MQNSIPLCLYVVSGSTSAPHRRVVAPICPCGAQNSTCDAKMPLNHARRDDAVCALCTLSLSLSLSLSFVPISLSLDRIDSPTHRLSVPLSLSSLSRPSLLGDSQSNAVAAGSYAAAPTARRTDKHLREWRTAADGMGGGGDGGMAFGGGVSGARGNDVSQEKF